MTSFSPVALQSVIAVIEAYLTEQRRSFVPLRPETQIMTDLGLDSLALAEILILLEEKTGQDPFASGFLEFTSIADLAALYSQSDN